MLAPAERAALRWLAARMPAWVTPDHLTALGLAAMAVAGACYALSRSNPLWLHAVNAALAANWFGDSLDGTLARYRNKQRPRFGFYVDHIIDAFGALFLLGGLALSGWVTPWVAVALVVVYYMLSINIYLTTYALGVFKISYGAFGGTELRVLVALANLVVLVCPRVDVLGRSLLLLDLAGTAGIAGLLFVLLTSVAKTTARLYHMERV